jgi:predicted membrane-bound spermidine synthase
MNALLCLVFLASGCASLLFETLWFRQTGLLLGNSVWASSLVTASFMGGLALGSALAARLGHRVQRPVAAYGFLELGVGGSGLTIVLLIPLLPGLMAPLLGRFVFAPAALNFVRVLLALALLLVPATAMGATLPILVRALTRSKGRFGTALGQLYGCNALGAVMGAILGEAVLIESIGVARTGWLAAGLDALAAVAAFAVSRRTQPEAPNALNVWQNRELARPRNSPRPAKRGEADAREGASAASGGGGGGVGPEVPEGGSAAGEGRGDRTVGRRNSFLSRLSQTLRCLRRGEPDEASAEQPPRERLSWAARRLLAASFLCGAIVLALEVVWFRFLQLFVFASNLTFALMLAVVLLGIGLGSLAASWWLRVHPQAVRSLPGLSLLAGVAIVVTYRALDYGLGDTPRFVITSDGEIAGLALRLMLPVCLLSGALFTLMGAALRESAGEDSRAAGLLTFWNTIGAMAGALAAGFVLLPRLGMERSLFALALGYAVVALLCAWPLPGAGRRRVGLAAVTALYLLALATFPFGLMVSRYLARAAAPWASDGSRVVSVREGLTETILWLRRDFWGEPVYHRLLTNGISMSSSDPINARYMKLFAYLPQALRPEARDALLISYGVGMTAQALSDSPTLTSIDVVDISREILGTGRIVFPGQPYPLDDPRVRVHVEDGRFFLLAAPRQYDIITGEPPPPKSAGIVSLYTREYFALLHSRLKTEGVATYWLPVVQLEPKDAWAITRAFCDVFDDCTLWTGSGLQWMLMGTRGLRTRVSEKEFARLWSDPKTARSLAALAVETPEQMGALFLGDARDLAEVTRGFAALDDDHPYRLSRQLPAQMDEQYAGLLDPERTRQAFAHSGWIAALWPPGLRDRTQSAFTAQIALNRVTVLKGRLRLGGLPELKWALTQTTLRTLPLWLMSSGLAEQEIAARQAAAGRTDPLIDQYWGIKAMVARDFRTAATRFAESERHGADAPYLRLWQALALCLAGATDEALELARRSRTSDDASTWNWIAGTCGESQTTL